MQKKVLTATYAPSSNTDTLIYAVHPDASYAEIKGVQVANTAGTDYEIDIRWMSNSVKAVSSTHYQGDGVTPAWYYYDYYTGSAGPAVTDIINDGYVPAGSVLSVLDAHLLFSAKDLVIAQPVNAGAKNKLSVTVMACEYFEDYVYMNAIENLDYRSLDRDFKEFTY